MGVLGVTTLLGLVPELEAFRELQAIQARPEQLAAAVVGAALGLAVLAALGALEALVQTGRKQVMALSQDRVVVVV